MRTLTLKGRLALAATTAAAALFALSGTAQAASTEPTPDQKPIVFESPVYSTESSCIRAQAEYGSRPNYGIFDHCRFYHNPNGYQFLYTIGAYE
ncbi:hypothetical protein [Salininema proteolyticum]|uniref:Secreted protein n=1 Tax=Salininema proteolyticum TaxID=1607685 RepID=A0ABV8U3F0_9ACTN